MEEKRKERECVIEKAYARKDEARVWAILARVDRGFWFSLIRRGERVLLSDGWTVKEGMVSFGG